MLPIRAEIVQYAEEIKKTFGYVKETNEIAHLVHSDGMWNASNVNLSIDNYEVFCVNDWKGKFKLYVSCYDMVSNTGDYKENIDCSVVKYKPGSEGIMMCGSFYTMEEAFSNYEEIYFQHSTVNHQCVLDAFDMLMCLHQDDLKDSFLLMTPMNIEVLKQFNKDYDKMMQDSYKKLMVHRNV